MTHNRNACLSLLLALGVLLPISARAVSGGKLPTRWDKDVSATDPLHEYPRPQMARKDWQSLNGPWDYALTDSATATAPTTYAGKILVPYPYEAALSGVGKPSIPNERLWYRRTFTVPPAWKGRHVLLHFGAVNWDSSVFVNGQQVTTHRGGYDGFDADITGALTSGANTLVVSAWNPLRSDVPDAQVLGKQRLHPGGIFYTASTGIWQSVWLEPVPETHIANVVLTPDVDGNALRLTVQTREPGGDTAVKLAQLQMTPPVQVSVVDGGNKVATATGLADRELTLPIPRPHLWTPDDPHLYTLHITLGQGRAASDSVDSYFAMRKVSLGKDNQGRTRLFLNDKFVLEVGPLDQGYWPDGLYTAPTDDALKYDIQMTKAFGFNLIRKHAKVEPDRWYYWTDKLGMLVWQDMPQCFVPRDAALTDEAKQQFQTELVRLVLGRYNHPSVIVWTTFNEGWGEHDVPQLVSLVKQLDPSRLVNDASGWTDMGVGDIADTHDYPGPGSGQPEPARAAVNGEFGGVTMRVPGHMWEEGLFGYGTVLSNSWQVTRRYQELLRAAYGLAADRGTSAFVYTQTTDVEGESNGLMTYDRAVVKPDLKIAAAANRGQFLPLPPNPNPMLVPTSQDEPQTWRYLTQEGPPAGAWSSPAFSDADWQTGPGPFGRRRGGAPGAAPVPPGDVWMRRTFVLPARLPAKLNVLTGHAGDVEVFVNGVPAASAAGSVNTYVPLPMSGAARASLHPGMNVLAVHYHPGAGRQFVDVGLLEAK